MLQLVLIILEKSEQLANLVKSFTLSFEPKGIPRRPKELLQSLRDPLDVQDHLNHTVERSQTRIKKERTQSTVLVE